MTFINRLGKICDSLGANPKATYPAILVATVKGICRPTFTMMDKKESPETKKYTALREGLTEVVAIPAYWACGEITAKLAKGFKFSNKPLEVRESLQQRATNNLRFIGVCLAGMIIIPALCSAIIKPLMSKISGKKKQAETPLNNTVQISQIQKPDMDNFTGRKILTSVYPNRINSGMRVGGI